LSEVVAGVVGAGGQVFEIGVGNPEIWFRIRIKIRIKIRIRIRSQQR